VVEPVELSEEELARLAEVEPAFVRRAIRAGALERREPGGGFVAQDATRLRFLRAWDVAGLPVEAIANLIRRGELPLSFLVGPTVDPHPRLAATYEELCADRGIGLATVQRLHDALGFRPPAASEPARADDLLMLEVLGQLVAAGADEPAVLRLLRVYADALRRLTQAEADLYESQVEEPLRRAERPSRTCRTAAAPPGRSCHRC
jgi:adenylate cyclase